MVDAGGGYDAGIGGESSVYRGCGGAMAALGSKGRAKDYEGLKRRRQWWAMERTKGGLKADPGGAPVCPAPFPELASESAVISWIEIDPTKVWGGEGVDGVPVWPLVVNVAEGVVP